MVEQLPFKQLVPSSNLGRPMIIRKPQVYACGFFVSIVCFIHFSFNRTKLVILLKIFSA